MLFVSVAEDIEVELLIVEVAKGKSLTMDKAYESDECRATAKKCGMIPLVPPKSHRKEPWEYDEKLYKGRNILERNFRNIKKFRLIFTRYDKLDETYNAFIAFTNIVIFMRN